MGLVGSWREFNWEMNEVYWHGIITNVCLIDYCHSTIGHLKIFNIRVLSKWVHFTWANGHFKEDHESHGSC